MKKLVYVVELEVDDCAKEEDVRHILEEVVRGEVSRRSHVRPMSHAELDACPPGPGIF